ncbi:MAG: hypothetical protein ACLQJ0_26100 [Steroidobacteraceae bacterium]
MTNHAMAFMANDRYYNWTVGFLESVRARNSKLPIFWIPYDSDANRIASLQRAFNFEKVDIDFCALDAFADRLFPSRPARRRNFRKFAALALQYDEIAYFDVDLVLCLDPARLFGHVKPGEADLVYFSTSPGFAFRRKQMVQARQLFPDLVEISSGAFVSSRNVLTIEQVIDVVDSNVELYLSLRQDGVFDQPVLNFVLAQYGKKLVHIRDCDATLAGMAWSRNRQIGFENGRQIGFDNGRLVELGTKREVVAVHWAGGIKLAFDMIDPRAWPLANFRSSYVRRGKYRVVAQAFGQHAALG